MALKVSFSLTWLPSWSSGASVNVPFEGKAERSGSLNAILGKYSFLDVKSCANSLLKSSHSPHSSLPPFLQTVKTTCSYHKLKFKDFAKRKLPPPPPLSSWTYRFQIQSCHRLVLEKNPTRLRTLLKKPNKPDRLQERQN